MKQSVRRLIHAAATNSTLMVAICMATLLSGCSLIERGLDAHLNPVLKGNETQNSKRDDKAFHESLFIVDLHADTLLYSRGLSGAEWDRKPIGHVDAQRLAKGNVAVQVLSTVSRYSLGKHRKIDGQDRLCHAETDSDLVKWLFLLQHLPATGDEPEDLQKRIEIQGSRFDTFEANSNSVTKILSADQFEQHALNWRRDREGPIGAILAIEGLHFYRGRQETLEALWEGGFRMASLTHHFDNRLAGSSTGCVGAGLTEAGKTALDEMRSMGWTLDLAHASSKSIKKALKRWADPDYQTKQPSPPLVSHTGFRGQCKDEFTEPAPSPSDCNEADLRNITENDALEVALRGGAIGVIYWSRQHGLDRRASAERLLKRIVRTTVRIDKFLSRHSLEADLCIQTSKCLKWTGSRYIALGSDWDGAADSPFDAGGLAALIAALRAERCANDDEDCLSRGHKDGRRFSDEDIRWIAGWNACRVLLQSLPGGRTEGYAEEFCKKQKREQ